MNCKNMLKVKVSLPLALLIMVTALLLSEQALLSEIKADNDTSGSLSTANSLVSRQSLNDWLASGADAMTLANTRIPLFPGAVRLTFDSNKLVRYRVDATAGQVTKFYRQILTGQGWKNSAKVSAKSKLDKLVITYNENPISKKTDITYAYVPVNATKVLGVKIAEADAPAPAPAPEPAPAPSPSPAPAPEPAPAPAPVPAPAPAPAPAPEPAPAPSPAPAPEPTPAPAPTPTEPQPMPPTGGDQPQSPMPQQPVNQMQFFKEPTRPNSGGQNSGQTCNINGVNLEGSCSSYNNMGAPGQQDGGKMNQQQQGPSEEDQKKMDERRFKDMKRGLSQFVRGVNMTKKSYARVKTSVSKCGVGLPEDLNNALSQADELISKVNAAKTADELDEISESIQDVGSAIQEWGPKMGDLTRLCQMIRQADRDAKQLDRAVKQVMAQAKANKKVDLSGLVNEYQSSVNAQKETLAQAKELAKTDPDSALSKIEDDFYGNMDNLSNMQMQISAVVNISRGMKDITRELNNFAAQIKKLAKKKIDTAEIQEMFNVLKGQVEDLKNAVASKADPEELISKIEEAFDARQNLQDALQEFGVINMTPQIKAGDNFNVKVNIPDAFRKANNSDNGDNE